MTSTKVEIAHHIPGRVRLKVPLTRGRPMLSRHITDPFVKIPGVRAIEIKPLSGSVVLYYDPKHLAFQAPNSTSEFPPQHRCAGAFDELIRSMKGSLEQALVALDLNRRLELAPHSNVALRIMVPLGLAAVVEICAAATPLWLSLVLNSLAHCIKLLPDAAEAPANYPGPSLSSSEEVAGRAAFSAV